MNSTYETSCEGTKYVLQNTEVALRGEQELLLELKAAQTLQVTYDTDKVIGDHPTKRYTKLYETKTVTLTPNDTFKYDGEEEEWPGMRVTDAHGYGPFRIFSFAEEKAKRIQKSEDRIAKLERQVKTLNKLIADWRPDL